ncbi:MAG: prepilin-type N-terminal cleavage/methylation domain-containing protein [Candidatus Paceibacterota bacterium]
MFKLFNKKIKENTSRGFTLVEMTIVAAIFAILTVIVVVKYGDFTSNLLVTNMAYEIALTTRQAQAFGVGVRGFELDGDRGFGYPYGVYFYLNDGPSRDFVFFVDRNDDKRCGTGTESSGFSSCVCAAGDECINRLTLQRNIRITEIEVGNDSCVNEVVGSVTHVTAAAVTFKRPSPEARIRRQDNFVDGFGFLQLKVEAPATETNPSYVLIRKNGQISVSGNDICGSSSSSSPSPSSGGDSGNSNE